MFTRSIPTHEMQVARAKQFHLDQIADRQKKDSIDYEIARRVIDEATNDPYYAENQGFNQFVAAMNSEITRSRLFAVIGDGSEA